jgi:hypothetical protein
MVDRHDRFGLSTRDGRRPGTCKDIVSRLSSLDVSKPGERSSDTPIPSRGAQPFAPEVNVRLSAVAAVQAVLPPWKEASAEAVNAIAYATRHHPEWFWRGAQHVRKFRRPN